MLLKRIQLGSALVASAGTGHAGAGRGHAGGRHLAWFAQRGIPVTGIDRDIAAARTAVPAATFVEADTETPLAVAARRKAPTVRCRGGNQLPLAPTVPHPDSQPAPVGFCSMKHTPAETKRFDAWRGPTSYWSRASCSATARGWMWWLMSAGFRPTGAFCATHRRCCTRDTELYPPRPRPIRCAIHS